MIVHSERSKWLNMLEKMMKYLSEDMLEQLNGYVEKNETYMRLEQEYQESLEKLKEALPSEQHMQLLSFEIAVNALGGTELELVYQKGLKDGIILMKELWLRT